MSEFGRVSAAGEVGDAVAEARRLRQGLARFEARELVRARRSVSGVLPLMMFERVLEGLPADQPGKVAWSAQGLEGPLGQPWLQLSVQAQVRVTCQRCLQPFALPVQSTATLQLAASAEEAEADPTGLPDDAEDGAEGVGTPDIVLCAGGRLDLFEQMEDELILALPYIPRHEVCPQPLPASAGTEIPAAAPRKPFAALQALKSSLQHHDEPDSQ